MFGVLAPGVQGDVDSLSDFLTTLLIVILEMLLLLLFLPLGNPICGEPVVPVPRKTDEGGVAENWPRYGGAV